ncbi:MAG: DUF4390 domain-containing protein [Candidatus Coatesbacteria bacterium]|nr:DUF4390 domain-containing protein [Candidatus Coatesbacteria bacterium]
MASIWLGGILRATSACAVLVACILVSALVSAQTEPEAKSSQTAIATSTASFEPEPRMTKPSAKIKGNRRTVIVKSRLLNWMNDDLNEFLESGLPLKLSFKAAIFEERDFWFDAQLASIIIKKQVTYDPVKKTYTVLTMRGDKEFSTEFADQGEAMDNLLGLETDLPIHLFMEKYPERKYYAGVYCDVVASEIDLPFSRMIWFLRTGYTTDWFYSERISTAPLKGDGKGKRRTVTTSPQGTRE